MGSIGRGTLVFGRRLSCRQASVSLAGPLNFAGSGFGGGGGGDNSDMLS